MATFPGLRTSKSAILLAVLAIALPGTLSARSNRWTPVGPEGGLVPALAADTQNPSTVYAATCAGIFKTVDGGANWSAMNSGPEIACELAPGILAVDPQNTGTVYALSGNQIFKTTDGGARWSAISTLKTTNPVRVLLIAPSDPNALYAGDDVEIFKSVDGGATWTQASMGAGHLFAVDPQDSDTLYAYVSGGLSKSIDGGASWNPANSCLSTVQVLAIDPQNSDTLYAGCGSANLREGFQWGGIFKSTDGGASWNPASFGLPPPLAPSVGYIDVLSLAVNPQNPTVIYALIYEVLWGGQGASYHSYFFLATSTDGAATWTLSTDPNLSATNLRTIAPDPQDAGTLYLGTSNGVLKTTDAGGHWNFTNSGLRAAGVDSLVADSQTAGTLFAVTGGAAGLFKSTDGGSSWLPSNLGLPSVAFGRGPNTLGPVAIPGVVSDPEQPGTLYALEVHGGGLFKSEDAGGSWAEIWSNGANMASATDVGPLAVAPEQPNVMYAGFSTCNGSCYSRIAKSTDAGHTWTDSQVALTGMGCCAVISSMAVDPQNPNIVYAGSGDDWDD